VALLSTFLFFYIAIGKAAYSRKRKANQTQRQELDKIESQAEKDIEDLDDKGIAGMCLIFAFYYRFYFHFYFRFLFSLFIFTFIFAFIFTFIFAFIFTFIFTFIFVLFFTLFLSYFFFILNCIFRHHKDCFS
jgi:hypothetical protein